MTTVVAFTANYAYIIVRIMPSNLFPHLNTPFLPGKN